VDRARAADRDTTDESRRIPMTSAAPTAAQIAAAGITYPPIDELLTKASSKYALAIYAAKRARQINDYYSQLSDGLLEYVGPLVDPLPREKPLSIALREINADLLEHTEGE
jgi:DNA-directed RNA polymerase subunit omega